MAVAKDPFSFHLLHGPYRAPRCRLGDKLPCKIRGRFVVVGGLTTGPIRWPYTLEPTGRLELKPAPRFDEDTGCWIDASSARTRPIGPL